MALLKAEWAGWTMRFQPTARQLITLLTPLLLAGFLWFDGAVPRGFVGTTFPLLSGGLRVDSVNLAFVLSLALLFAFGGESRRGLGWVEWLGWLVVVTATDLPLWTVGWGLALVSGVARRWSGKVEIRLVLWFLLGVAPLVALWGTAGEGNYHEMRQWHLVSGESPVLWLLLWLGVASRLQVAPLHFLEARKEENRNSLPWRLAGVVGALAFLVQTAVGASPVLAGAVSAPWLALCAWSALVATGAWSPRRGHLDVLIGALGGAAVVAVNRDALLGVNLLVVAGAWFGASAAFGRREVVARLAPVGLWIWGGALVLAGMWKEGIAAANGAGWQWRETVLASTLVLLVAAVLFTWRWMGVEESSARTGGWVSSVRRAVWVAVGVLFVMAPGLLIERIDVSVDRWVQDARQEITVKRSPESLVEAPSEDPWAFPIE